jgi:hypothetical protein
LRTEVPSIFVWWIPCTTILLRWDEAIEKREPEQVILRREVGSRAPAPRNTRKQRSRPSRP